MITKSFQTHLLIREAELVATGYQYCWSCGEWVKSRYRHDQAPRSEGHGQALTRAPKEGRLDRAATATAARGPAFRR